MQIRENGGKPKESVQFNKEWLGDLAPKQFDRGAKGDNTSDQVHADAGAGVVQGRDGSGRAGHLSVNHGERQFGDTITGSSGLGADAQPLVAVHNGHSVNFKGRSRSFEQAEKAIGGAPLRRIRMGDTGKKTCGPEGNGNSSDGEPTDAEAYPNSGSDREKRCVDMLPGRHSGDIEAHDDMETGVASLNGVVKEAGMEYDRSCNKES